MLSNHKKSFLFFLMFFLKISFLLSESKPIKKISSDITEYDRIKGISIFYKNVIVDLENGYLICDKAKYEKKNNRFFCESNVYFVFTSTEKNLSLNVKSFYADYDGVNDIFSFKGDVDSWLYDTTNEDNFVKEVNVKSSYLSFLRPQNSLIFKDNVVVLTKIAKIFCDEAQYFHREKLLKLNINTNENLQNKIKFISLDEKFKLNYCESKECSFNLETQILTLNGNVEVRFRQ